MNVDNKYGGVMVNHRKELEEQLQQINKFLRNLIIWFIGQPTIFSCSTWTCLNKIAKELYASFGFVETGEKDGEELIAVLKM